MFGGVTPLVLANRNTRGPIYFATSARVTHRRTLPEDRSSPVNIINFL